jgi:glycosyltransferase involved in cell wall biosynthesis
MKILIYSHVFAPAVGGVETMVLELARGLATRAQVTLVTQTPGGGCDDAAMPFCVVRQPGVAALVRWLRWADIVHLAGPALVPLLASLLLRKRVVVEHHGFQAACPNGQLYYEPTGTPCPGHFLAGRHRECLRCNSKRGWGKSFAMWLLTFPRRWLCRGAPANVTPTAWVARALELPHATTIHHGLSLPAPAPPREESQQPIVFAFVGRLVSTKGVDVLLEAARILRERGVGFELRIIGEGPERTGLEARVRVGGLGESVRYLGFLLETQLETVLQDAAAIVMPSLGGEVFGLVAAENMLRGKAVIVSDLGSLREVVAESGLTVPAGDAAALAAAMQQVATNPAFSRSLGAKARERAARLFSREPMIQSHLALYQGLR